MKEVTAAGFVSVSADSSWSANDQTQLFLLIFRKPAN
jgi:hypothetical protein